MAANLGTNKVEVNAGVGAAGANPGAGASAGAQQNANTGNQAAPKSIGFGVKNGLFLMNSSRGSEFTNEVAKKIMDAYQKLPQALRPRVHIFDKQIISNLAYSHVVVSLMKDGAVSYFIVTLEATGREPLTAKQIMAEIKAAANNPNHKVVIYTADDTIDKVLHAEIKAALEVEYKGAELIPVDGVIVPYDTHEIDLVCANVAAIAYNACSIEAELASGRITDLNITEAIQNTPNAELKITSNMLKQTAKDAVGKPVRADFILELGVHDKSQNLQSLNLQETRQTLSKVSGFIEALPRIIDIPTGIGMPPIKKTMFAPNIIIDSVYSAIPTTGYALLSILTATLMTNDNMWPGVLIPEKGSRHNPGALNIFSNINNNQNGVGEVFDLASGKYTKEEVIGIIKQLFNQAPVISMDIEAFGPETYYESVFGVAAQPQNSKAKVAAAKEIVETASWLTNGHFPADFPINEIFKGTGVIVPIGKWADKDGEKDIREIDLTFIATHTGDIQDMNTWMTSMLPKEETGIDPFINKVSIINKIIPDAVIEGKAIRVTFTPKFITTLINAAVSAGLDTRYEPIITFQENNNLGLVSNYFADAGIANAATFARQTAYNQPQTPFVNYGNMGIGRLF